MRQRRRGRRWWALVVGLSAPLAGDNHGNHVPLPGGLQPLGLLREQIEAWSRRRLVVSFVAADLPSHDEPGLVG